MTKENVMGEMSYLRGEIKQFLSAWFELHIPGFAHIAYSTVLIVWITIFAIALHLFLHKYLNGLLVRFADNQGQPLPRELLASKLYSRIAFLLQGIVVKIHTDLWLNESSLLLKMIDAISNQWILLFTLLTFFSLLNVLEKLLYRKAGNKHLPLRGLIQTVKLIACVLIGLVAISDLIGKSPLILLSGFGALSAVMLLVFKDPILGLVAGIQLSANRMVSVGDWLEMPKYSADGDVVDIALTTVKVQNWDKSITTIPTYALISDSFKNWRGMSDAGGRRIKRSVLIETGSIRFLDKDLLLNLRKVGFLSDYLEGKIKQIECANEASLIDMSTLVNGRRLTNIGTFRAYLISYLQAHQAINHKMTLMVRQLDATSEGLPIQIYAFTNTTNWIEYEDIQSDLFDHVFAVLPEFDLRVHESPTSHDVRLLKGSP